MSGTSVHIPLKLLMGFVDEASSRLSILKKLLLQLDITQDCSDGLNAIKRDLSALRDNAAFFGLAHTRKMAIRIERLLKGATDGKFIFSQAHLNITSSSLEYMRDMLSNIRMGRSECENKDGFQRLIQKLSSAARGEDRADAPLWSSILERLEEIKDALQPKIGKRSMTDAIARELCKSVENVIDDCRRLASSVTEGQTS